ALQVEQQKWAVKAEELFQAGEQLFMNAEAELKEAIRQAKIEYERDAQERREAGNARAGAYLEMYITSGTVVSAAVENIRFWAGGMGKEKYPPAGSEEFDDWLRNELVAEMDALVDEYNKMENEPLIQVWVTVEQKGGGSNQSSASSAANAQNGNSNTPKKVLDWVENPEYAAEAAWRDNVLDAWAELKPAGADSLSVKAALEALFGTVIAGNDRDENKTFVEEMIRRMDSYREIELWSDLFKTYMEKAKEARTSLLNDFNVVIGKDAGGLVDVLNDTFSSEDFFLDEYQVELIRAEAVKNYWAKRQGIAEAVAWYANLATGDRTTAGDLAANWEKARGDYNDALEEYRKAQSALTENGAKILAAQDALNAASNALNEANTKLNRLYAEYGELMAAYVSDDSSFFAYEFSNAYQALIENTKTVRATGTDAMYADYLEHAARYYDEAALDRESALLKEIVTDGTKWSGDRKDFALSLLAAASLEEWHYGTLEREPPVNNAKDSLTIRERLEQERDEKKKAASLEKIKMMQNEEYDGELIAELDSVVAVLGTMIEVLDYTGDISSAVRNDNGERAIENIRQIYAEWGLGMEGYLLPSPRETAQSLFYAEGDVIQNIAGFLGALDKEFAALPGFLFNEAQSWKGAFIEYFAVKMKDAGIQATINEAEIENVITTDLEKIQEAEKTNQVFVEHNLDSARYLCAVIGLGIVFPLVSVDDLRREAAKRIAAELVTLYTDAERQDSVVIKEHLGEFRQENYGYADEDIWEAALDWAAAKIIERENIQSFDGVTSYAREYTLTDYEKEAIDSRVFLEESGLLESEYSFYADVSQLADFVIAAIEAMKTANAKQDDADTSDPESADSEPPDPESADSEPTDPESADSEPTDPESADSEPTDPESEDSEPTDPESADSEPTDPESADSEPTDPEPEESEQEDSEPAEPDFTEVIEYLSARKDEYGALFVIPARVLAYTLARRMESAADLEKVLAALELDVYENAETIWEKAYREDFDLMDCVLHFAGNDQTASAIAGSVILARLKFFAYTGDETNFAHEMEMAEGESPVSGAVLEAARQFKDTVDKGAQYYGYEISGDLFEWVLKIQGGNVEKAIELADFVMFGNSGDAFILALTGNEGGQKDYFSVALRKAVNSHIETLKEEINNRQNILDLAAARHAVDEEIENLVHNGKEHWRYYISKTITDSNDIFTKYNNGITDEDDKLKPGSIGIPDEPADESSGESANEPVGELAGESANGANGEPAGESNSGIKSVNTITAGFLADAFERLEFEAGKLNAAFAYYDTVKNSSPLAAYNDTVRSYMEERAWDDEDLRPADYQYTELYRNAASDMASHFYTRDHLQREIGKNGAAIILAKQDETERGALLKKKLEEIVTQKGQYAAMLDGMNGAAAAFEEIGRDYEAAYQASKEAFKAMEDSRFEYEKQDAIKQWASTAYLASDDADLPVSGEVQYRSPTAELAYSGERLRNATAALDALSSLYDNGEKERAYEDKEYLELYTKYEASFSRMMTAIKTSAALNKAIAEETVNNQNLYSDYLSSLNELTGGFNLKSNFSEPETEKTSPSEGEVVTEYYYTINHFITVDNGKLAFNFASGNSFGITISDDGDKSLLTEFLTPKEIDKRVDATRNETSKVSDFELAVRELSERLAARYTDSAGFGEMALAREYLLRRIKESSGSDFADSHMYKYEEDPIAVDEDGSIGRLYYGTNRQVYESAERKYASVELEQEQVWNSLSENEKDDIEFWTILTLMGGTVPDEFSKTGAKVYESLWSTVQGYQTSNQTAGIVMYAMGALLLGLPGGQIMAAIYLAGSMLFFYESNLAGEARNRLAYMVSETAQKVNETQSAVFMNFADIDRKLKAYHESCDRLAALIGEAEEGETADWALMQTSLETAGIEEETIRGIQAIWQDLKADKTWESVYSSSAAALEGTASWSRREKENTKRSLEDEWAGDEQARQEAEAAYREVYSRYIEGNADIAELQKAASGAFGKEAAAQKKLLADITGVTMANFQGVTIDGSAFGGEYVTLAQDYIGMISRAYAVRYTAEWTARSAAWEAELADIQQKRQAYRESAQLIQQRGLAEWNEGMKNMLAAYNDWRNRFVGEYERVSGNWDAAYLAGLLEKEEWANRATEAAMDASKAALFAASGAENTARVWDTFTPSGMLAGDAVSQSRGLLMATLNGAGIAGFEAAFGTISGGAATIAPEVRRGLSAAAVLDAGRIQVKAATLAREANEDLSERELKRIAEMVRLAAEEAVKGLQDSIEEANRSFDESMDNTFKLGGQWTRSGNTYRKAVIVSSTLIDAAVTETKTVEAYRYYSYNEELKTDMSSERIEKLDGYSVRALIAAVQNEVDGFAEMLFGTPEQNDDIVNRTKWIDIIKAEQVQTGTRTVTTIDAQGKTVAYEVPVYETRDVSTGKTGRVESAGLFGGHIGYQSVARKDANTDMDIGKYFHEDPYGEMGRLMEYFEYYQAVEGEGVAKMGMAAWDKSLWDDRNSWFKAPTLRSLTDMAVSIALGPAGGGMTALLTHAGLGLIDDAVFGIMDLASGKDALEVGVAFGKKALTAVATAKLNTAFGGLNAGIDGMAAGIDKTISQMGAGFLQGTVTSMATSTINSVTYSADGGWGFDSDGFS
ncbi:MAG: hypothetical protein LBK61_08830, partial [Spirochaetaceae bacterium]|nr:hypothetical protein [Spirochaetaceae bacterium]